MLGLLSFYKPLLSGQFLLCSLVNQIFAYHRKNIISVSGTCKVYGTLYIYIYIFILVGEPRQENSNPCTRKLDVVWLQRLF